jgi:hypothetical protein
MDNDYFIQSLQDCHLNRHFFSSLAPATIFVKSAPSFKREKPDNQNLERIYKVPNNSTF